MNPVNSFSELLGRTLRSIDGTKFSESLTFTDSGGYVYKMYHSQSCCEAVDIEDICGDLADVIGSPILLAEEITEDTEGNGMFTFYKLSTVKGHVTIRWYGGPSYYSIGVDFEFSHKIDSPLEKEML